MADVAVTLLLLAGLFFFAGGAIGILRFPDFYSRLHPAGKLDTLGLLLMMTGIVVHLQKHFSIDSVLIGIKILSIVAFVFVASPTATHSIVDAGMRAGMAPWRKEKTPGEQP